MNGYYDAENNDDIITSIIAHELGHAMGIREREYYDGDRWVVNPDFPGVMNPLTYYRAIANNFWQPTVDDSDVLLQLYPSVWHVLNY